MSLDGFRQFNFKIKALGSFFCHLCIDLKTEPLSARGANASTVKNKWSFRLILSSNKWHHLIDSVTNATKKMNIEYTWILWQGKNSRQYAYWTSHICRFDHPVVGVRGVDGRIVILASCKFHFTLLEYKIIWCKIQLIINPKRLNLLQNVMSKAWDAW